jgi:O-antigen/teichoic acid export membrane protein
MGSGIRERLPVARARRRFSRDSALFTILSISKYNYGALALTVLATLLTARIIGPTGKGVVAGATSWTVLLVEVGCLGFPQAITYEIAGGSPIGSVRQIADRFARFQVAGVVVVGACLFGALMSGPLRRHAVLYLATVPMAFLLAYRLAEIQGARRYRPWNRLRTLAVVAPVLGGLVCALLWRSGSSVLLGYGLGLALAALVTAEAQRRSTDLTESQAEAGDGLRTRMLHYGVRTGIVGLMSGANRQFDQAILALMISTRDLGVYAAAVSLSSVVAPVGAAYASYALASVPSLEDNKQKVKLTIRLCWQGAAIFGGIGIVGACVAPGLLTLAFGEPFADGGRAARILFLAAAFLSQNYLLVNAFLGMGLTTPPLIAQALGLASTLILLVLLVPRIGFEGAAWASLLSYMVTCAFLLVALFLIRPSRAVA